MIAKSKARCLAGGLVILVLVYGTAQGGPPERRPLTAKEGPPVAAAAGDERAAQLFYYSDGQKIYLNDTGLAVAKLSAGVTPEKADVRPLALAPGDPLRDLLPTLQSAGLVVINTEEEGPSGLRRAAERTDTFEYVMPIVEAARGAAMDSEREPGGEPTRLIMTPRIAARFAKEVEVEQYVEQFGLEVAKKLRGNLYTLQLREGRPTYARVIRAANRLYEEGKQNKQVLFAHPDFVPVREKQQTEDPRLGNQWHLENNGDHGGVADADIDALAAWRTCEGSPSIRIAVIDDSVQQGHPDLPEEFVGHYYNGITGEESDDPSPRTSRQRHGTSCAGVAVGAANTIGVRGAAPRCGLIGVHFWDASVAQTADAFRFSADPDGDPNTDDGAAVISCSWSWNAAFDSVRDAVEEVATTGRQGRGIVVLFAAANDYGSISMDQWFGTLEPVITVGATNWRDDHSPYSNHGPELDVVAPSSDIDRPGALSIDTTDNTDAMPRLPGSDYSGYARGDYTGNGSTGFGGTSSATPLTAGVCGLILSVNGDLSATQVRAILEHTADRVRGEQRASAYDPTTSHDQFYGYGRINAKRSVAAAHASLTDPDAVWPDHVLGLEAAEQQGNIKLNWRSPEDNVAGVLVVRADVPIRWKPTDGERYQVGDLVADGGTEVISIDNVEVVSDSGGVAAPYYAVFAFNAEHRYSWGQAMRARTVAHERLAGGSS